MAEERDHREVMAERTAQAQLKSNRGCGIAAAILAVVVVGWMLVSSMGGDSANDSASPTTTATTKKSTTTELAAPANDIDGWWECTDPAGDATGRADLVRATISGDGDTLGINWITADAPERYPFGYYVMVDSKQIGLKYNSDTPDKFVFDIDKAENTTLRSVGLRDGDTAQLVVPTSKLDGVTTLEGATITVTADERDSDTCTVVAVESDFQPVTTAPPPGL